MKIKLPLKDVFAIYTATYLFMQNGPPDRQELLGNTVNKLREQIAKDGHEAELADIELFIKMFPVYQDAHELQGPAH